jgi:hypothetical protein
MVVFLARPCVKGEGNVTTKSWVCSKHRNLMTNMHFFPSKHDQGRGGWLSKLAQKMRLRCD